MRCGASAIRQTSSAMDDAASTLFTAKKTSVCAGLARATWIPRSFLLRVLRVKLRVMRVG